VQRQLECCRRRPKRAAGDSSFRYFVPYVMTVFSWTEEGRDYENSNQVDETLGSPEHRFDQIQEPSRLDDGVQPARDNRERLFARRTLRIQGRRSI
jgi:hypothetical protein